VQDRYLKIFDRVVVASVVRAIALVSRSALDSSVATALLPLPSEVTLLRPGGMGDAVLLLPLIKRLAQRGVNVHVLGSQRSIPFFNELLSRKLIASLSRFESLSSATKLICSAAPPCVIDTEQSFASSALLSYLSRARVRIGFDTKSRRALYTHGVAYNPTQFEAQCFLKLLAPFGISDPLRNEELLLDAPTSEGTVVREGVVLAPWGSHPERYFKTPQLINVVQRYRAQLGSAERITLVGPAHPTAKAQGDELAASCAVVDNRAGKTTFPELIALLQKTRSVWGIDSGVLHLATASGVPDRTGYYGPTVETKWAAPGVRVVTSSHHHCRPCTLGRFAEAPPCPYHYSCITEGEELV
jgi:ADP-heptose:LPS heptosyltransferase